MQLVPIGITDLKIPPSSVSNYGLRQLNHLSNTHDLLLICNQIPRMDSRQAQKGIFGNEIKDRHTDQIIHNSDLVDDE
jgi:hypothetical protein